VGKPFERAGWKSGEEEEETGADLEIFEK